MAWFRVDDHLHSHRKAVRAGTEAMGLWILAGSWSSAEESDGWVPGYMLTRLAGANAEGLADRLVSTGLWHADQVDGEDGYRFHQWEEHQPTRAQLEQRREANRERMRGVRSQGGKVRANGSDSANGVHAHNADTVEGVRSTPARPDPSLSGARKRATQLPSDFTPNDTNRRIADERGLDLAAVVEQWSDFHRAKGSLFKDWHAALNTWLRREQPTLPSLPQSTGPRQTAAQCGDGDPHVSHTWSDRHGRNRFVCAGTEA